MSERMATKRCSGTLGSKPWWMSWDQYDPCPCLLPEGHDGDHWCEHLDTPDPRKNGSHAPADNPHESDGTTPEACAYCGDVWPCAGADHADEDDE